MVQSPLQVLMYHNKGKGKREVVVVVGGVLVFNQEEPDWRLAELGRIQSHTFFLAGISEGNALYLQPS